MGARKLPWNSRLRWRCRLRTPDIQDVRESGRLFTCSSAIWSLAVTTDCSDIRHITFLACLEVFRCAEGVLTESFDSENVARICRTQRNRRPEQNVSEHHDEEKNGAAGDEGN